MGVTKIPSNLPQTFPSNRLRNGTYGQTVEKKEGGLKNRKIKGDAVPSVWPGCPPHLTKPPPPPPAPKTNVFGNKRGEASQYGGNRTL